MSRRRSHHRIRGSDQYEDEQFDKRDHWQIYTALRILRGDDWELSPTEIRWLGYEPESWWQKKAPKAQEFRQTALELLSNTLYVLMRHHQPISNPVVKTEIPNDQTH